MARKVVDFVVPPEADGTSNRDTGKVFVLTEMPATQAEKWAARLLLSITKAGMQLPDDVAAGGMAGVAALGLKALGGVAYENIAPLMDEMFTCVTIRPDPLKQPHIVRPLVENDIEEIKTRFLIRTELIALHTGFFLPGFPSMSVPWAKPIFTPEPPMSPEQ